VLVASCWGERRLRDPNAIDFWRGFALITIFINHIPGNAFERFTYSGHILSDAAELFVFLAGWSLALATQVKPNPDPPRQVILRVASRTLEVYRVQIVITVLAVAIIAAAAVFLDNPLLLEWHNAGPFFSDPVQNSIGLVLLTYQLGYFNILPLYVVLLAVAPVFILLARWSPWAALALSASIYTAALIFEANFLNWPGDGHWFFNPLAWQFLLVLGFVTSVWARTSIVFRHWATRLIPLGALIVALGWASVLWDIKPDPYRVPEPRLLFLLDKSFLSPARLLEFVGLVLAFHQAYPVIERVLGRLVRPIAQLGRNSLEVFAVGSVLSLLGQLVRATVQPNLALDTFLVGSGIVALVFTAWFSEWRSRSPKSPLPH
jgi:hypothetical protein